MLTKSQINKIQKAKAAGTGVEIKISKSQIRKSVKKGGNLFTSLAKLAPKIIPKVAKVVPKIAAPLATGAMSALYSLGVDKLFGKGQAGGMIPASLPPNLAFMIPREHLNQLDPNLFSKRQQAKIMQALLSGEVVLKPTKTQMGGFLETLLASVGIPLLLSALTGKANGRGLQLPKRAKGLQLPKRASGLQVAAKPYYPPPFFGNWGGANPAVQAQLMQPPFYGNWSLGNFGIGSGTSKKKNQNEKPAGKPADKAAKSTAAADLVADVS